MKMTKIENSNYSFDINKDGTVKLYRHNEDVTEQLNYNIVIDMAYMINELNNKLDQITQIVDETIDSYTEWNDDEMCKYDRANGMEKIEKIIKGEKV